MNLLMLAQAGDEGSAIFGLFFFVIWLAVIVAIIAGGWKLLEKAGQPGWGILIPFYNIMLLLKIGGLPMWMVLLFLIPFVNFVMAIVMWHGVSKNFGRGIGTTLGLIFLGFIFVPILGFGSAQYNPAPAGYSIGGIGVPTRPVA